MAKKLDDTTKNKVRIFLMEELIDRCAFLNAQNKKLTLEKENAKPTEIESKDQISYIN